MERVRRKNAGYQSGKIGAERARYCVHAVFYEETGSTRNRNRIDCLRKATATRSKIAMHFSPIPYDHTSVRDLPIIEAFSIGRPVLTPKQRGWMRRILQSGNYDKLRPRVAFCRSIFRTWRALPMKYYRESLALHVT